MHRCIAVQNPAYYTVFLNSQFTPPDMTTADDRVASLAAVWSGTATVCGSLNTFKIIILFTLPDADVTQLELRRDGRCELAINRQRTVAWRCVVGGVEGPWQAASRRPWDECRVRCQSVSADRCQGRVAGVDTAVHTQRETASTRVN